MKAKRFMTALLLGMVVVLGLAGCKAAGGKATQAKPTPTILVSTQAEPLATPHAQEPAAGICASPEGEIVKVILNSDMPDPRCTIVSADQKLDVVNHTQSVLEVSIGRFTATLEPGVDTLFDTPFGEYLAPGVHQVQVSPCCGAELWLKESK